MKKIVSFIMALLLVFSALPVSAEPVEELPEETQILEAPEEAPVEETQAMEAPEAVSEVPLRLSSLCFRKEKRNTSALRSLEPEFSSEVTDYTLTMKDYEASSSLFLFAELTEDAPEKTVIEAKWDGEAQTVPSGFSFGSNFPELISENSLEGNILSICLGPEEQTEEVYRVEIYRQATLKSLTLRNQDGKELISQFQRDTQEYTVAEPVGEGSLRLTAEPTASGAPLTVGDTAVTAGAEITCAPEWDENGLGTLSVKVGQGDSETEYTIALRKTPPKPVRLELVTAPQRTAYRVGEDFDSTGLTLKVVLEDQSEQPVDLTKVTFTPEGSLSKDQTKVTAQYEGLTLDIPITVLETLEGSGTPSDPYKLYNQQDMELLDRWVESGIFEAGSSCRMEENITIEGSWSGLGSRERPFSGDFDGQGHRLTLPEGSSAVFTRTREATIHDLKVYGPKIADYGLVSLYEVDKRAPFCAKFEKVTLVSGTKTLHSGFIGGYASSEDPVYITDCTVESGVTIGYEGGESHIGSFAGEFNGFVKNCKSSATVYGGSWVGGLVGNQGQSMADCRIEDCTFDGTVEATGNYVGGILGGGYAGTGWGLVTAPNGRTPSIISCRFEGSVHGGNAVGGIFGAEACVQQTWQNGIGRIQDNVSLGRVSAEGSYVGGVIGFMQSLNRYNEISGNYYENAKKGIGAVAHVDTSAVERGFRDGTYYYDTSKDSLDSINCTKLQTYVELSAIGQEKSGEYRAIQKTNHNRDDDPLGADKDRLCYTSDTSEPFFLRLETSGSYKKTYTQGEDLDLTGIELVAVWSDGERVRISLDDVDVRGYDPEQTGDQSLRIHYQGVSAHITVTVKPQSTVIHVSVTILGDDKHGKTASPHGLARGGLKAWAREGRFQANASETVWDVLKRLMAQKGLSVDADDNNQYGTVYIRSVNGLGEFDNGPNSGWMYTLNGTHPLVGVSAKYVSDGDEIVLHYTDDYTYEEDGLNNSETGADGTQTTGNGARTESPSVSLEEASDIYETTGDYMESLGTPSVGPIGGEWMVIGLARSGKTVPGAEDYYKTALKYIQGAMDQNGRLHKAKSTDNSRMILALTALGKDMTQVEGGKLLEGLSDLDFVCYQGNNGPIWALLALDCGNYPVAKGATATRAALIDTILAAQTSDGGWAITGDKADSDMTGMALQALAPYVQKDERVAQAVEKALARLSEMQNQDGSFSTYGSGAGLTPTSESISQVLTALSALGIDADSDPRFVKSGGSVIDALLAYSISEGGFRHLLEGERDGMATEQAYYALTAYFRFLEGKTSLYDMTDIVNKGGDPVAEEGKATVIQRAEQAAEAAAAVDFPVWTLAVTALVFFGLGMLTGRRKRK